MDKPPSQFKNIIFWSEFRAAWILLAVVIAAAVIDIVSLTGPIVLVEAGLLFVITVVVFVTIYRVAKSDRETTVERNELRSIMGSLNDALIVYDPDFRVTFFNPAAERIFNITASAVIGHTISPRDVDTEGWKTLVQVVFPSLAPRVIARTKEGVFPQTADVSFTDPPLEFRVTTAPVIDEAGRTLAFMKIIRNRTAEISALRSRSEFVTVASHQLRGPVSDINWALDTLSKSTSENDPNKSIIENTLIASKGLLRRIEDLLNITKMEEGQFGYEFEDTDAAEFVGKILADVLPAARKEDIKIYFDRPAEALPHVMIDPRRLSLALLNILENAIRYNVQNGEVTVKVDRMPGKPFLVISVKDTGIGVPPESIPKLFAKFYRADNAAKVQTEGSGLGLYIAKNIISAHGGQIWAESELNRGTIVYFSLPTDPALVPRKELGMDDFF